MVKFRDKAYSVDEGVRMFTTVIEKVGNTPQGASVRVRFVEGSATGKELYQGDASSK